MKNNIYDIAHIYMEEIFVPVCAIQNNVEFLMIDGNKTVRTADGALSEVVQWQEYHILSEEASMIIKRIYKIGMELFFRTWYKRNSDTLGVKFLYLKLKRIEDAETPTISAAHN